MNCLDLEILDELANSYLVQIRCHFLFKNHMISTDAFLKLNLWTYQSIYSYFET